MVFSFCEMNICIQNYHGNFQYTLLCCVISPETRANANQSDVKLTETRATLNQWDAKLTETHATLNQSDVKLTETRATLNQSDEKLTSNHDLVAGVSPRFRLFFILSSHWPLKVFSSTLISRWNYFGFGFWIAWVTLGKFSLQIHTR